MRSLDNKKTIYFVRHGQSVDNASPVFQSPDSPLNEKGKQQARAIAERITSLSFDVLLSSTLPRAMQTAEAIAEATNSPIEAFDLFVERIKPTEVDGKSWHDKTAAQLWDDWNESLHKPELRVADGENYTDIVARADKALDLLANHPAQNIVVVTHGYFLRTMVARAMFGDTLTSDIHRTIQDRFGLENTGITVLRHSATYENKTPHWRLWTYNDHAHFAE